MYIYAIAACRLVDIALKKRTKERVDSTVSMAIANAMAETSDEGREGDSFEVLSKAKLHANTLVAVQTMTEKGNGKDRESESKHILPWDDFVLKTVSKADKIQEDLTAETAGTLPRISVSSQADIDRSSMLNQTQSLRRGGLSMIGFNAFIHIHIHQLAHLYVYVYVYAYYGSVGKRSAEDIQARGSQCIHVHCAGEAHEEKARKCGICCVGAARARSAHISVTMLDAAH
jgi:hypothetical protein